MIRMTALRTTEDLASTRSRIDVSTGSTLLRTVRCAYKLDRSTGPVLLVTNHLLEHRPSRISDPTRTVPAHHSRDVQVLQHDDTVTLGESRGLLVRMVSASSSDFAALPHKLPFCFLPVLGSFLSTGNLSLCPSELLQRSFQVLRSVDQFPVGGTGEVDDAAIDRNHGIGSRGRIRDLDLAEDRCEPLISVSDECAALGRALKQTMDDYADRPELREVQAVAVELPDLRMRFAQVDNVDAFPFPARGVGELLEAALPRFIKLVKKLHRYVARNFCKPRQFRTKLGQILRLIKRRHVAALAAISSQSKETLLIRKVPEKPQSTTPPICRGDLLNRRVGTVAEGFADQHRILGITAVRQLTRRGFLPVLNGGTSALKTG